MKDDSAQNKPLNCEDIQGLLFDYMSRELGDGRSDLVREHLRKCETCRTTLAEMEFTMGFLQESSKLNVPPSRLSDKHYARLLRALTHPVLDWIYVHHIIVSFIVALLAVAVIYGIIYDKKMWREFDPGETIRVIIGKPPAPEDTKDLKLQDLPVQPELTETIQPSPPETPVMIDATPIQPPEEAPIE